MSKVLGINYSGFHDTSIVIANSEGNIEFASSLERVSRVKGDGRSPNILLERVNWTEIDAIAISANKEFEKKEFVSVTHPQELPGDKDLKFIHQKEFYDFIDTLPKKEIHFYDHEFSHAASAFWPSGFEEAICLVYDGGMVNQNIFGGVYHCSKEDGIRLLDGFDITGYAKITGLYTVITSILNFTPGKHEGKITGLAALGEVDPACLEVLETWFIQKYDEFEKILEWYFSYAQETNAILYTYKKRADVFKDDLKGFSNETIAASLQYFTEQHVLKILDNIHEQGWLNDNICLAGGLFANVKLNQKISEYEKFKFKNIYIAPPMGDEGTALGAACNLINTKYHQTIFQTDMFLGDDYSNDEILKTLKTSGLKYKVLEAPVKELATILAKGNEIAFFKGKMEFGPRALGHRSIIAPANDKDINNKINQKLNRTEFMPFAPMTLKECLDEYYIDIDNKMLAMQYMTISCKCKDKMKKEMPAVVHTDMTARPQIIEEKDGELYEIMNEYYNITSLSSIVNTSFNIHEEPIVNTPSEAIKGFLTSGLAYLYFSDAKVLISYEDNKNIALEYLHSKLREKSIKDIENRSIISLLEQRYEECFEDRVKKEEVIQMLLKKVDHVESNYFVRILKKIGLMK